MRSLQQRVQEFLEAPLPGEIALNHNPNSLTEMVLGTYTGEANLDAGLVQMAKVCLSEMDAAVASVHSDPAKAYFVRCRKLLEEILLEVS